VKFERQLGREICGSNNFAVEPMQGKVVKNGCGSQCTEKLGIRIKLVWSLDLKSVFFSSRLIFANQKCTEKIRKRGTQFALN
jgi:hypothetical protein